MDRFVPTDWRRAPAAGGKKRKASTDEGEGEGGRAPDAFSEGARCALRTDPRVVGAAQRAAGSWYALRLDDGKLHQRSVRLADLRPVGFQPQSQLPEGFALCAAALDGALACLTWQREPGGRHEPFPCRLRAEPDGALQACYFDDASDNERLWVAVRAADARVVAFRDDGAELSLGVDDAPNCLEIDEVRLRHAAAAAEVMEVDEDGPTVEATVVMVEPACPLRGLLAAASLDGYADALLEQGYDDVAYLRQMDAARWDEMARRVRMKPGHIARLKSRLAGPN